MIVDIFKTEKELFDVYPKMEYFKLKDIFNDYWDDFLIFAEKKGWKIRPVVQRDVKKMVICNTKNLGTSVFKCHNCGNTKFVYNTCKSRFCNSCGIKYAKERALNIESKLISGNHRHLVFTVSDCLWRLFLEKRSILKSLNKWRNLLLISFKKDPLVCDVCSTIMEYDYGYT